MEVEGIGVSPLVDATNGGSSWWRRESIGRRGRSDERKAPPREGRAEALWRYDHTTAREPRF
jgi:hypothetical protein